MVITKQQSHEQKVISTKHIRLNERIDETMKKTYKIDVDCANCAEKMQEAARKTKGVKDAVVNFMALKMNVEFEEGADEKTVMADVLKNCKKVEDDCEIFM
jgi:cation transport ATPase